MEETKGRIVNTALRLFSENGYGEVTVRDIAADIGITQGALYRYFTGKKDIYDFIFRSMSAKADSFYLSFAKLNPENYRNLSEYRAESVKKLCFAAVETFKFWTENETDMYFRRLMEIERYSNGIAAYCFNRYFCDEPLNNAKRVFRDIFPDKNEMFASDTALRFYSPIYLSYSLYDACENKVEVAENLKKYISRFCRQILRKIEN